MSLLPNPQPINVQQINNIPVFTIEPQLANQIIIQVACTDHVPTSAFIDTGSPVSIMTESYYLQLRNVPLLPYITTKLTSVTGDDLIILGQILIPITMANNLIVTQPFYVARNLPNIHSMLLGLDFCTTHIHNLNWTDRTIQFKANVQQPIRFSQPCYQLQLTNTVKIPAHSSIIVRAVLVNDNKEISLDNLLTEAIFEPNDEYSHVSSYSLVKVSNKIVNLQLENHASRSIKLLVNTVIGSVSPVKEVIDLCQEGSKSFVVHNITTKAEEYPTKMSVEDEQEVRRTLSDNVDKSTLADAQKKQLKELLYKNISIFGSASKPLTSTDRATHRIDTGSSPPVFVRPYRMSPAQRQEIDKNVTQMLQNNIIKDSISPYSSPVLLVKKPDGSFRFCIDYRKLNLVTKKDVHPLPRIDETLDLLGQAQYYSTLDLLSGFWQVPLHPDDAEKTAFSTDQGHYEFLVLPFGLCNAPSTFQRLMNNVLKSHRKFVLVYIDDVIVYSPTFDEHLKHLQITFDALREAKLTVKANKCNWGKLEVKYLGHLISNKTVKPDPAKVSAVQSFPTPKCLKDLQTFIGLIGYYRRFVPNMATVAAPLYKLMKKNTEWRWEEKQETAMKELKHILTSTPLLRLPDFTRPFILHTDANDTGLGAILCQEYTEDGVTTEHPINYASRSLNKAERNYSTTDRECLALLWSIALFRPYLVGVHFTVYTDHSALQWLLDHKDSSSRLMRMVLRLQEYDYTVISRPGSANANADALSRLPALLEQAEPIVHCISVVTRSATGSLPAAHRTGIDPDLVLNPNAYDYDAAVQESLRGRENAQDTQNTQSPHTEDSDEEERDELISDDIIDTDEIEIDNANIDPVLDIIEEDINNSDRSPIVPPLTQEELESKYDSDSEHETHQQKLQPIVQAQRDDVKLSSFLAAADTPQSDFILYDNLLYRVLDDEDRKESETTYKYRFVVPDSIKPMLLREYHDGVLAAHSGEQRTYDRIKQKYWWLNMKKEILDYVRSCTKCNCRKPYRRHQQIPVGSLPTPHQPFECVSIDILGPLPSTRRRNKYILVVTDHYTRWPIAIPLTSQRTTTVATALIERVFCEYGFPATLLSDRGTSFLSNLMTSVLHVFRIKKLNTSAYHPQCNGMTERFNHTLATQLTHYCNSSQTDWDEYLPYVLFAYRTAPHRITRFSPYYMMYGREAKFPIDTAIPAVDASNLTDLSAIEYVSELVKKMKELQEIVIKQSEQTQQQKEEYNRTLADVPNYSIGSKVLLYIPVAKKGQSKKLTALWKGPYEVTDSWPNRLNYRLQKLDKKGKNKIANAKPILVHVGRIKPYVDPDHSAIRSEKEEILIRRIMPRTEEVRWLNRHDKDWTIDPNVMDLSS